MRASTRRAAPRGSGGWVSAVSVMASSSCWKAGWYHTHEMVTAVKAAATSRGEVNRDSKSEHGQKEPQGGSTLTVEPAASLCAVAAEAGARLVIVNRDPTPYDRLATAVISQPIGEVIPEIVDRLLVSQPG